MDKRDPGKNGDSLWRFPLARRLVQSLLQLKWAAERMKVAAEFLASRYETESDNAFRSALRYVPPSDGKNYAVRGGAVADGRAMLRWEADSPPRKAMLRTYKLMLRFWSHDLDSFHLAWREWRSAIEAVRAMNDSSAAEVDAALDDGKAPASTRIRIAVDALAGTVRYDPKYQHNEIPPRESFDAPAIESAWKPVGEWTQRLGSAADMKLNGSPAVRPRPAPIPTVAFWVRRAEARSTMAAFVEAGEALFGFLCTRPRDRINGVEGRVFRAAAARETAITLGEKLGKCADALLADARAVPLVGIPTDQVHTIVKNCEGFGVKKWCRNSLGQIGPPLTDGFADESKDVGFLCEILDELDPAGTVRRRNLREAEPVRAGAREPKPDTVATIASDTPDDPPPPAASNPPPPTPLFRRPVKVADAAKAISKRSDIVLRSLRRRGCVMDESARPQIADFDDIVRCYPTYRKRLTAWAERDYPMPD